MPRDAHRRLRTETREDHERLERHADILARAARPEARPDLVQDFHRLHADVEAACAPWLEALPGLDFAARRRSRLLEQDMTAVGAAPRPAGQGVVAGSAAEALGLMYVLEGSTLGAQLIRRHVAAAGADMRGLSFLDPYGAESGARWRAFLAVLDDAAASDADVDAMVAGALAGFRHAQHHLCKGRVHG